MLGLAIGVALFWYGGVSNYFPAIVATMILIGVLIPLENQERRLIQLFKAVQGIQNHLDNAAKTSPKAPVIVPGPEKHAFIPTIQSDTAASSPVPQKKRTIDQSLEDVAKKLSSMQG